MFYRDIDYYPVGSYASNPFTPGPQPESTVPSPSSNFVQVGDTGKDIEYKLTTSTTYHSCHHPCHPVHNCGDHLKICEICGNVYCEVCGKEWFKQPEYWWTYPKVTWVDSGFYNTAGHTHE